MFKNSIQKNLRQRYFITSKVGHNFSGVLIHSDRSQNHGYSMFVDVDIYRPDGQTEQAEGTLCHPNNNIAHAQIIKPKLKAASEETPDANY